MRKVGWRRGIMIFHSKLKLIKHSCRTGYQWPVIKNKSVTVCTLSDSGMGDDERRTILRGARYRSVAPAGRRSWDFHNRRDTDSYLTIPSIYRTSSRFPEMPILKWVHLYVINVFYSCQFLSDKYHGLILLSASYQYNSKDDICAEALGRLMSLVLKVNNFAWTI